MVELRLREVTVDEKPRSLRASAPELKMRLLLKSRSVTPGVR